MSQNGVIDIHAEPELVTGAGCLERWDGRSDPGRAIRFLTNMAWAAWRWQMQITGCAAAAMVGRRRMQASLESAGPTSFPFWSPGGLLICPADWLQASLFRIPAIGPVGRRMNTLKCWKRCMVISTCPSQRLGFNLSRTTPKVWNCGAQRRRRLDAWWISSECVGAGSSHLFSVGDGGPPRG
jgi:hypothetical protein